MRSSFARRHLAALFPAVARAPIGELAAPLLLAGSCAVLGRAALSSGISAPVVVSSAFLLYWAMLRRFGGGEREERIALLTPSVGEVAEAACLVAVCVYAMAAINAAATAVQGGALAAVAALHDPAAFSVRMARLSVVLFFGAAVEELVFRRWLPRALSRGRVLPASARTAAVVPMLVAQLLFAASHLTAAAFAGGYTTAAGIDFGRLFVIGCLAQLLFCVSRRIAVPIAWHALSNLAVYEPSLGSTLPATVSAFGQSTLLAIALLGIYAVPRARRRAAYTSNRGTPAPQPPFPGVIMRGSRTTWRRIYQAGAAAVGLIVAGALIQSCSDGTLGTVEPKVPTSIKLNATVDARNRYGWVGSEHNRAVHAVLPDIAAAAARRQLNHQKLCALIARSVRSHRLSPAVTRVRKNSQVGWQHGIGTALARLGCASETGANIFMRSVLPGGTQNTFLLFAPMAEGTGPSSQASALVNQLYGLMDAAPTAADYVAAVGPIINAAASLSDDDESFVLSATSVATSSYAYWEQNLVAFVQAGLQQNQSSIFGGLLLQSWESFLSDLKYVVRRVGKRDVEGCVAGAVGAWYVGQPHLIPEVCGGWAAGLSAYEAGMIIWELEAE